MKTLLFAVLSATLLSCASCVQHHVKTEPIEVKPITLDINITKRVDRDLDDFFAFEDEQQGAKQATQPPAAK